MSTLNSDEGSPQLFECVLSHQSTPYWLDTPWVLVAGEQMLTAAGEISGAPNPEGWSPCARYVLGAGWTRGAGGFKKRACDGIHTLHVYQWGEYWLIERWARINTGRYKCRQISPLVFAFGRAPIWTRTCRAAMRLAEHCDPIPRDPVAGYWVPAYTCT